MFQIGTPAAEEYQPVRRIKSDNQYGGFIAAVFETDGESMKNLPELAAQIASRVDSFMKQRTIVAVLMLYEGIMLLDQSGNATKGMAMGIAIAIVFAAGGIVAESRAKRVFLKPGNSEYRILSAIPEGFPPFHYAWRQDVLTPAAMLRFFRYGSALPFSVYRAVVTAVAWAKADPRKIILMPVSIK